MARTEPCDSSRRRPVRTSVCVCRDVSGDPGMNPDSAAICVVWPASGVMTCATCNMNDIDAPRCSLLETIVAADCLQGVVPTPRCVAFAPRPRRRLPGSDSHHCRDIMPSRCVAARHTTGQPGREEIPPKRGGNHIFRKTCCDAYIPQSRTK